MRAVDQRNATHEGRNYLPLSLADCIRQLKIEDLESAAVLMARAFQDDPYMAYLIPDAAKRLEMLPKFYRVFIKASILNHHAYGVGVPLDGVAIWSVPDQERVNFTGLFRSGLFILVFQGFLFPFIRAIKVMRVIEGMQKKFLQKNDFYLNMLAVSPESQGRGCASKLVRPFLEKADSKSSGVYVKTMKLSTNRIYEHFGFQCKETCKVKTGLSVWALYRPQKLKPEQ